MQILLNTNRIAWIDNIRAFAILMVILGHSLNSPDAAPIVRWIVSFNMPLFVIISGYCAYHNMSQSTDFSGLIKFMEKTTTHILLPAMVGTFSVYFAFKLFKGQYMLSALYLLGVAATFAAYHYKDRKKLFAYAYRAILILSIVVAYTASPYWFLTMTWTVIVLMRILTIVLKRNIPLVACVALALSLAYSYYTGNVRFISEFSLYFVVGMYMRKFSEVKIPYYPLLVLSFLVGIETFVACGNTTNFYQISISDLLFSSDWYYWPLRQLCGIAWSIFFVMLFKSASSRYSYFSWLGGGTLGMYIMQGIGIKMMAIVENKIGLTDANWLAISMPVFLIDACVSIFIIYILSQYKSTRVLYLGKK